MVQCLSLLHRFAKYSQNPGSVHCRFVQIFDKDLKCLIYLGYWRTKHWKYLVFEKDAKADTNLVVQLKSKFSAALFVNWISKISHVLSFFCIWMVSFRRTYCYWLSITYFILLRVFRFFLFFFFFLSFFVSCITCWGIEVSLVILKIKQWSYF